MGIDPSLEAACEVARGISQRVEKERFSTLDERQDAEERGAETAQFQQGEAMSLPLAPSMSQTAKPMVCLISLRKESC